MSKILFILAAICFALDAFSVDLNVRIRWTPAGFCLLTIAIWLV